MYGWCGIWATRAPTNMFAFQIRPSVPFIPSIGSMRNWRPHTNTKTNAKKGRNKRNHKEGETGRLNVWLTHWLAVIVFAPVNWAPRSVGGWREFINVWFGPQPTFSTQWQQTFTFCMLSALDSLTPPFWPTHSENASHSAHSISVPVSLPWPLFAFECRGFVPEDLLSIKVLCYFCTFLVAVGCQLIRLNIYLYIKASQYLFRSSQAAT